MIAALPPQAQTATLLATGRSDSERTPHGLLIQPTLPHHPSVDQENRYPEVIESE